jgi:UPF0755 protein
VSKPRISLLRRLLGFALLLTVGIAASAHWLYQDYLRFADAPIPMAHKEHLFEVKRGDSFVHVLRRLRKLGIHEGHDLQWRALAWDLGVMRRLQVGEYAIDHDISPRELLRRIERGDVVQHRFTIIPGITVRELRLALARDAVLRQTLPGLSDEALMAQLGSPGTPAEGQFLPETYQFTRGASDVDILKRAHLALRAALCRWPRRRRR